MEALKHTLILGLGNVLLTDEGFGVHCLRYLEQHYQFPSEFELYDGGTLGLMLAHKLEEAERVFLIDIVDTDAPPGTRYHFSKPELMTKRLPVKLSPHQIGIQELLLVSEMRGRCPADIQLFGVTPHSLETGLELSPLIAPAMTTLAEELVAGWRQEGWPIADR